MIFLFYPIPVYSAQVNLSWDCPNDSRVTGYKIYYGRSGTDYKNLPKVTVSDPNQSGCLISDLIQGYEYVFAATSFDDKGNESDFSNTISYTVPDQDSDGDGLTDTQENDIHKTDPNNEDTDGDNLDDGQEVNIYGTNPLSSDTDGDGLTDGQEVQTYNTNPLSKDTDGDGMSDGEEVAEGRDPIINDQEELKIVHGSIPLDHNWSYVSLNETFNQPVVVAGPLTRKGGDPCVVRIKNVTGSGFEIKLDEYKYLDGSHTMEVVDFIVMEEGRHVLNDGTGIEAGSFKTDTTWPYFDSISFKQAFMEDPVVISTVVSENEAQAVTGRIQNITSLSFQYSMQEEEASDHFHLSETIHYIAWEPSSGIIKDIDYEVARTEDAIDSDFKPISFQQSFANSPIFLANMQTSDGSNPANLRIDNKSNISVDIQVDEEASANSETSHVNEVVGYIALEDHQNKQEEPEVLSGEVSVNHEWSCVTLNRTFTNPVIVAGPLSHEGGDPSVVRIRNLTGSSFEIRVDEYEYLDEWHKFENVGFIIMEQGQHLLDDGKMIEAGSFQSEGGYPDFDTISFTKSFNQTPVVMTSVITENEPEAVASRIRNVDASGFEYVMQEEEDKDQNHCSELVHYIAWEPSSGVIDGLNFEVVRTKDSITDNFTSLGFQQSFTDSPVFLGDMQTCDGSNPANLRINNKSNFSIEVQVDEEQSKNSEVSHTTEAVGYLAIEPTK